MSGGVGTRDRAGDGRSGVMWCKYIWLLRGLQGPYGTIKDHLSETGGILLELNKRIGNGVERDRDYGTVGMGRSGDGNRKLRNREEGGGAG
jgi:hypothetical protein